MFLKLATIALIPALLVQGYQVKKNTPRLAEALGERNGLVGNGPQISILILGDSAAAGVGVQFQEEALSGTLLQELRDHFQIRWSLIAKTGNCTSDVIRTIQAINDDQFDIVVTSIGVNDVTQLISPQKWICLQEQLYSLIAEKFSPKLIIATGVPPMNEFPALPNPLAWLFGKYAHQMNVELENWIEPQPKFELVKYDLDEYKQLNLKMAEDGFHPSKEIYQLWAKKISSIIQNHFRSKS
ncbi:SGNH/GDSL hydrolase family protein [Acinetobacter sp. YH12239]|uniref:SGNH/GDSL hydrolase family protein n=1 Tax=Acinetobacter sp. YH12239 TaxID=2601166 RepID=UPI0015D4564E|nr:SGNH/GDSL hydrolase family protein [Acinetobacter sp. YH12239]